MNNHTAPKRCYESHPALLIAGFHVYGGSCSNPVVKDADVYVGLDHSYKRSDKEYPWEEGVSFLYPITDMAAPRDPASFKKLIDWLAEQILDGKKVHIGCIGGHGRTGTVLSALVAVLDNNKDAITYVRNNYCKKAVESEVQIAFLHTHFGITKVEPSKGHYSGHTAALFKDTNNYRGGSTVLDFRSKASSLGNYHIEPAKHKMIVWGDEIVFDKSY